jgi:hypothetical protein
MFSGYPAMRIDSSLRSDHILAHWDRRRRRAARTVRIALLGPDGMAAAAIAAEDLAEAFNAPRVP